MLRDMTLDIEQDGPSSGTLGKRKRQDDTGARPDIQSIWTTDNTSRIASLPELAEESSKRLRLEQEGSQQSNPRTQFGVTDLSPEILQHIFSFVNPISLGCLLSVCRLFHTLLDPDQELPSITPIGPILLQKQNDLWAQSRRVHLPGYPRPLFGTSELQMWRLLRVRRCQFCQKKAKAVPSYMNSLSWNSGPGPNDVRSIWPFAIRSCGPCLENRLKQDTELLLSGSSVLRPGLSFAIFTPSFNYVTSASLRQNQTSPELKLAKYYYRPDIDELENKLVEVQALGSAAAEEWFKGLQASGQEKQADAERLEQWELGFASYQQSDSTIRQKLFPRSPSLSLPSVISMQSHGSAAQRSYQASITSPPRPIQRSLISDYTSTTPLPTGPEMPLRDWGPAPGQTSARSTTSDVVTPSYPGLLSHPKSKTSKSQNIDRIRAQNSTEIQRRCQSLDPPIRPSVLPYMEAFKAFMLVPVPLNDASWDRLRPRLLNQRQDAERREREHLEGKQASDLNAELRHQQEQAHTTNQVISNRLWSEIETPPRQKLKLYADEYIANIWAGGISINALTSTRFAADLLVSVKKRFDEEVVREDAELATRGITLPHDSDIHNIRRLKLEDLKWLYEESVRPQIERFGKDVFLCSECRSDAKRFPLDGLIQHFAAKHTKDYSRGNVIVHWRSDWPKNPPFHTFPDSLWNGSTRERTPSPMRVHELPRPHATPSVDTNSSRNATGLDSRPYERPRSLYDQHQDEVVASALAVLEDTDNVRGWPQNIRLYVVIQCVARSFASRFPQPFRLDLFATCVNHIPALRTLRDMGGLHCCICSRKYRSGAEHSTVDFWLPQLLDHFQRDHMFQDNRHAADRRLGQQNETWRYELVDLPPPEVIQALQHARGMDERKVRLLHSIFPALFTPDYQKLARQPHFEGPSDGDARPVIHYNQYVDPVRRVISLSPEVNTLGPGYGPDTHQLYNTGFASRQQLQYVPMGEIRGHPRDSARAGYVFQPAHNDPAPVLPFRPVPTAYEQPQEDHHAMNRFNASNPDRTNVEQPATDVEHFLNSFNPFSGGRQAQPMSRNASMGSRAMADDSDKASVGRGGISHATSLNDLHTLGVISRGSDTRSALRSPHQSPRRASSRHTPRSSRFEVQDDSEAHLSMVAAEPVFHARPIDLSRSADRTVDPDYDHDHDRADRYSPVSHIGNYSAQHLAAIKPIPHGRGLYPVYGHPQDHQYGYNHSPPLTYRDQRHEYSTRQRPAARYSGNTPDEGTQTSNERYVSYYEGVPGPWSYERQWTAEDRDRYQQHFDASRDRREVR